MQVNGTAYRTIWMKENDDRIVQIIDQRFLPHRFVIEDLRTVEDVATAIREMHVRGAPLIGVTAAFGMYLATTEARSKNSFDAYVSKSAEKLQSTRPTAINLKWALNRQLKEIASCKSNAEKIKGALDTANKIADEDVEACRKIGKHGLKIIESTSEKKARSNFKKLSPPRKRGSRSLDSRFRAVCSSAGRALGLTAPRGWRGGNDTNNPIARKVASRETVNILTHCNAGWLACIDWGTATSAIYQAFNKGIDIHVWVDETRPRNQGASLTAWELGQHGVPHTVIADNTGGHLMQHGMVDLVIVGTDRTTRAGDVANKIGTYLKALAAKENGVPFYAAVPSSSIDWTIKDGVKEIPIEKRSEDEVKYIQGFCDGEIKTVLLTPEHSRAENYAFDVTPRKLITGLITERGVAKANEAGLLKLFPECRPTRSPKHF